ncbi:MAG: hypothetical protein ABI655_14515 [Phenylobacterium sp.]
MLRALRWALGAVGLVIGGALVVLCTPQPLFAHHLEYGRYQVWSDRPIPPEITAVLDDATRRLERSELYGPGERFRLFFCNDNWRLALYSQRFSGRMGGVADTLLTRNVYLRQSDIARNRLIPPSGWRATMADRPLSYYLAHELTHVMESRAFGRAPALRYPPWLLEGYADYIGKAGQFDYAENRLAMLARAREMDPRASGLYRLYPLEVAYMMDRRGQTVRQLFADPPPETEVRAAIAAGR